jgi:virulence-associated protein VagC
MKTTKVKLFESGNSQAVRLPKGFDFPEGGDIFLQRDELTRDVLVSRRPGAMAWGAFFSDLRTIEEAPYYLGTARPLNMPFGDGGCR